MRSDGEGVDAIEAYWRCDPDGMTIAIVAIVNEPSWRHARYSELELAAVPAGRTHTGPVWPEAAVAVELGERLARELDVPFHFASRDQPRDEVMRWWNRGTGPRCDDCGIELDQNPAVHWVGMCYQCHVTRELAEARVRIELLRDVDAHEYDRIRALLDDALHEKRAARFYAGSRVAGAQAMWFLTANAQLAADIAAATLREAGVLEIRVTAFTPSPTGRRRS